MKAKGLAILTVVKAGFLVTARAGSGIVIAKQNDDLFEGGMYHKDNSSYWLKKKQYYNMGDQGLE